MSAHLWRSLVPDQETGALEMKTCSDWHTGPKRITLDMACCSFPVDRSFQAGKGRGNRQSFLVIDGYLSLVSSCLLGTEWSITIHISHSKGFWATGGNEASGVCHHQINVWKGKVLRVLPSGRWVPRNQGWLNFWETRLVTVRKSLHRSCWTELTCQGILLP